MPDVQLFVYVFFLSGLAGLAALLRSKSQLNAVAVATSILNCGLIGLAISLLWYLHYKDNLYGLIGICIVAGLGGLPVVEFVIDLFKLLASKRLDQDARRTEIEPKNKDNPNG